MLLKLKVFNNYGEIVYPVDVHKIRWALNIMVDDVFVECLCYYPEDVEETELITHITEEEYNSAKLEQDTRLNSPSVSIDKKVESLENMYLQMMGVI